jgi:hypothetical protein
MLEHHFYGDISKKSSPQTRHRAKQIEEERGGKPRVIEESYFVANPALYSYFVSVTLI